MTSKLTAWLYKLQEHAHQECSIAQSLQNYHYTDIIFYWGLTGLIVKLFIYPGLSLHQYINDIDGYIFKVRKYFAETRGIFHSLISANSARQFNREGGFVQSISLTDKSVRCCKWQIFVCYKHSSTVMNLSNPISSTCLMRRSKSSLRHHFTHIAVFFPFSMGRRSSSFR